MEILNVIVIMIDEDMSKILRESLGFLNFNMDIEFVSDLDQLEGFDLEGFNGVVLVDSQIDFDRGDCYLVENLDMVDESHVYRYGSISTIANTLIHIYSKKTGHRLMPLRDESTKIVTVSSARGGSGVTLVSIGLGRELTEVFRQKVLYVDMAFIRDVDLYFDGNWDGVKPLKQYIYYGLRGNKSMYMTVDGFLIKDSSGLNCFFDEEVKNVLRSINFDEFTTFINVLIKTAMFDYIIFDVGTLLDDKALFLMENSQFLIELVGSNRGEREIKRERFIDNRLVKDRLILEKKLTNGENLLDEEGLALGIFAGDVSFDEGRAVIDRNNQFGRVINALADEIHGS